MYRRLFWRDMVGHYIFIIVSLWGLVILGQYGVVIVFNYGSR